MKRMQSLQLVLCVGIVWGIAGCGNSTKPETAHSEKQGPSTKANSESSQGELSSPEEMLEAVKAVDAKREYDKLTTYFTADAQKVLAGGLYLSSKNLIANLKDFEDDEQNRALIEAIEGLLSRHDLQKELEVIVKNAAPDPGVVQTKGEEGPAELTPQQKVLKAVGEEITDPNAFIADCFKTIQQNGRNPNARLFVDNARLENLKIEADHAEAELVFTRDDRKYRGPVGFQNVAGEWKFSTVPDVLYK